MEKSTPEQAKLSASSSAIEYLDVQQEAEFYERAEEIIKTAKSHLEFDENGNYRGLRSTLDLEPRGENAHLSFLITSKEIYEDILVGEETLEDLMTQDARVKAVFKTQADQDRAKALRMLYAQIYAETVLAAYQANPTEQDVA